jgi:hypothetical protein
VIVAQRLLFHVLTLALFAVAFSIAYGEPPPQEPPKPGIAVVGSL